MLTIAYRLVNLLRDPKHDPDAIYDAKYYIISGVLMFLLAFGIWNIDNAFCDAWTGIRAKLWGSVSEPSFETPSLWAAAVGAVTQGHAWWHLLTGFGCARIAAGASCKSSACRLVEGACDTLAFRLDAYNITSRHVRAAPSITRACTKRSKVARISETRNRGAFIGSHGNHFGAGVLTADFCLPLESAFLDRSHR